MMKEILYNVAFWGAVGAVTFWSSAYITALAKCSHVAQITKSLKRRKEALNLIKVITVHGVIGTLFLFWAAIEFGMMAQDNTRSFGSFILNEVVSGKISGVLMGVMVVAIIVMGLSGFHDYFILEGMRENVRVEKSNKSVHIRG